MTVVLYRVCPEAKTLLQTIRERRCDAVVIVPPEPVADQLGDLRDAEIPTMLINGGLTGPKMGYIGNESYSGAVKAMEYPDRLRPPPDRLPVQLACQQQRPYPAAAGLQGCVGPERHRR